MVRAEKEEKLRERQALYGEFITEASRLTVDALSHSLEKPETMVKLFGILGRIRLVAGDTVLATAEACCRQIVELYARPNMTVEEMRVAFEQVQVDPLQAFSTACRKELLEISGGRRSRSGESGYETKLAKSPAGVIAAISQELGHSLCSGASTDER